MGIIRNILLTVGLIWAVLFRVYPSVAGTGSPAQQITSGTVKQATHAVNPATDSAVFLIQDEDEQQVPSPQPDFLPTLPTEWLNLLLATLLLLPILRSPVSKPSASHQPYYLLYCSLRIPAV